MSKGEVAFMETDKSTTAIEGKKSDKASKEKNQGDGENLRTLNAELPRLMKATGFSEKSYRSLLYPVLRKILSEPGSNDKSKADKVHQLLCTMAELNPRDGLEGMLIGQMLITFQDSIKYLSLADHKKDYPDISFRYQNQGIKLMRLYTYQLETLDKHRNKGKQKMTVKHVHVHSGGQAIVGEVNQGGR